MIEGLSRSLHRAGYKHSIVGSHLDLVKHVPSLMATLRSSPLCVLGDASDDDNSSDWVGYQVCQYSLSVCNCHKSAHNPVDYQIFN